MILLGIPYPPVFDRKVDAKKKYLDLVSASMGNLIPKKLNSKDWYSQQMIRAMNQCIGRVIRH